MSTATDMLAAYLAAEAAVLKGKDATIGDRRFRLEDLDAIRAGRKEWEGKVAAATATSSGAPKMGGLAFKLARLSDE